MIVTLYLITANVYNSVKAPPSRGFSYIEVWMLGAQAPILIAILEYGAVLHMKKYARKQKTSPTMVIRQKMAFQQEQYETLTLDDGVDTPENPIEEKNNLFIIPNDTLEDAEPEPPLKTLDEVLTEQA